MLYPAYYSYKAVKSKNVKEYVSIVLWVINFILMYPLHTRLEKLNILEMAGIMFWVKNVI